MNGTPELRDRKLRNLTSKFDLQHLHYAVATADHGSFRKAAEALMLRHSTLSRCIRQLEQAIGVTVFDRSSSGVRATQAGQSFLQSARSILEQMDTLLINANSISQGEFGRLAVGLYTSLSVGNLRATLTEFKQRFPQVELGMVEWSRTRLIAALRTGALDVAILTGDGPHQENSTIPLWSERTLVALPDAHSLANRDAVHWTDLRSETVLLSDYDLGRELEDLLMSKLVSPEDRPKIKRHDVSRGIIVSLVSAGFGISLVTESDVGVGFSNLIYRELRDGTGPSCIGYSAHWRADNDNPALEGFLKILEQRYPLPSI
jgi:DNA-binding transcriptional LysR family regulator